MVLTVSNHAEETAAGVIVLLVLLQMVGKLVDLLGEKSDLNLRRTGVGSMNSRFLDDFRLLSRR